MSEQILGLQRMGLQQIWDYNEKKYAQLWIQQLSEYQYGQKNSSELIRSMQIQY